MAYHQLTELLPNQPIVFGGDRVAHVTPELAEAFEPGDRLLIDDHSGELLHVPAAEQAAADKAVTAASDSFSALQSCTDDSITDFFHRFAAALADDSTFAPIAAANEADIERARGRGRSTTRLELTDQMRADMVDGLRGWANSDLRRHRRIEQVDHPDWAVESWQAPLGVVGFVFEGRPNVFADAAGVLRTGNTVVFRIGGDALDTATAIVDHALGPSLAASGLPAGAVSLVRSRAHAAGWALFDDSRLALAVARGSGPAVAQLGGVARRAGNAVSLHGTGGAWIVADETVSDGDLLAVIESSLDRKVCNTLNTLCVVASDADRLLTVALDAAERAGRRRGSDARVHATEAALARVPGPILQQRVRVDRADGTRDEPFVSSIDVDRLGDEWEWENSPEITLHVVDSVDEAVALFNRHSPRFVASLLSSDATRHDSFYEQIDAPFVGDGFTRWVDGQYALNTPELGLSNWEFGRMLGRGGILSGASVYTVRYRASITKRDLRR